MIALAARFVPAADEVGRLQRGEDEECRLFQRIAEQGHYAGRTEPSDTRQGIYAAAPSGVLLASINTRDAGAVAEMLRRAWERWEALPAAERERATDAAPAAAPRRWEARFPGDGLVLRVVARDVGRAGTVETEDWRARAWNQDFAWFTRAEAETLVPAEPVAGAEHAWPDELARRLVRCHLVDDVRGQVPAFRREEVEQAALVTRVVAVEGERLELAFAGTTRAAARGRWPVEGFADRAEPKAQERSLATELVGRATFDRAARRFTRFELVAVGTRAGGTQFNGRGDDLAPAPIGFALTLAGATPAERVAPALIWEYGWPPP